MRISRAFREIEPLLRQASGKKWSQEHLRLISDRIFSITGKRASFCFVTQAAADLARQDLKENKTFSFNIIIGEGFRKEIEESSFTRRRRFEKLFSNKNVDEMARFGIVIPSLRGEEGYTIQVTQLPDNTVVVHGIMAFYNTSLNTWLKITETMETTNQHPKMSTHYMPVSMASGYVRLLN